MRTSSETCIDSATADAVCHDPLLALKTFFGHTAFRTYNGEPLQENAIRAAIAGESLLTVFPTGGGKSITFQLPALMAWRATRAPTIVISPLLSLMKDQVDNLHTHNIHEAVTINGLVNPVERARAVKRTEEGSAALLYISPEQLRSGSMTRILKKRTIARLVVDEAHCFSAWGHDFRVDYLYIGDLLRELQKQKSLPRPIPVSCFTATAKQQVINEITTYFQARSGVRLRLFRTEAERVNLHYHVTACDSDDAKYIALRQLILARTRPTIVYVSRTKRAEALAQRLTEDRISARPFHGKMAPDDKIANQNAFIQNDVRVMVATSAFGMGVDKKDIGLVIHHDISPSLEDYLQESGRAGRDPTLEADCHVLYNPNDLNDHFSLLAHSEIHREDINRVWKAIRRNTRMDDTTFCSAYELARQSGWHPRWEEEDEQLETRVQVAVSALEQAQLLRREQNTHISLANSLREVDLDKADMYIENATNLNRDEQTVCKQIIQELIEIHEGQKNESSAQIDRLADTLNLFKVDVFHHIHLLRELGLLADDLDISACLEPGACAGTLLADVNRFHKLETLLLARLSTSPATYSLKDLNEAATRTTHAEVGIHNIRTLLLWHVLQRDLRMTDVGDTHTVWLEPLLPVESLQSKAFLRYDLCRFILRTLLARADKPLPAKDDVIIPFSVVSLLNAYRNQTGHDPVKQTHIEEALYFLLRLGIVQFTGGFLIHYNRMKLTRIVRNDRIQYTEEDFAPFQNFYRLRRESVHIVGEYARLMLLDPKVAKRFVRDYFNLDYEDFVGRHFKGLHACELKRSMTPEKYKKLFGSLSDGQRALIDDADARVIVAAAAPGSGKTRVLVHKLASLLLLESTPPERVLMLTFSRAAANEFKQRLLALVGPVAHTIEIKTFHAYCLDVLGRPGSPEVFEQTNIIAEACALIRADKTELHRITKSLLILDEAQDMGKSDYELVRALMQRNPSLRVIAVGDDDQSIFSFRGSNANHLRRLDHPQGQRTRI